jgi:nucleoside-diphosphate-sugar epimerase
MFTPSLFPEDLDHVLAHTRDDWEELRGGRLFLTGGTGFFGTWLIESFLWANQSLGLGAEALVLSRNPAAFLRKMPHLAVQKALTLHAGDVTSFDFPPGHFSHVVHAATAASASLNAEAPLIMVDTIVTGTRRTLDFARFSGAKKFLLTSSGAVYGPQPPEIVHVSEEYRGGPDPLAPASAYGEGKRLAEHLCSLYARCFGIDVKISRGFAFVGPYLPLDAHFAIGNFIRDALAGGPIAVGGDGTPLRSYLYAADLAVWLWKILFHGKTCRAYNIGSDSEISIAELARTVSESLSPGSEVRIALPASDGPRQIYVPAVRRAREELGLEVRIPLDESLRRTGRWHRNLRAHAG